MYPEKCSPMMFSVFLEVPSWRAKLRRVQFYPFCLTDEMCRILNYVFSGFYVVLHSCVRARTLKNPVRCQLVVELHLVYEFYATRTSFSLLVLNPEKFNYDS